jgi:poly(3-hydroxybutyrate) depolymerase
MFYQFYEMNHAAMMPLRASADMMRQAFNNPVNPLSNTAFGRSLDAGFEVFERLTRRYGKPQFELSETVIGGKSVGVSEEIVWSLPFCNLIHFKRDLPVSQTPDPKVLLVAPMSGHYATLLRGTVEALLPSADLYITDWLDARTVALTDGRFDLDDYIEYLIDMIHHIGEGVHVVAVCQPSVPVLAAVSLMEADEDTCAPASMTLMGGPIDTRINPTAVNEMAKGKPIEWFRDNVIMHVPWPQPGFGRAVYPGFLQLTGFMSMNLDKHMTAHKDFYDEYLAVMDLTAEFYLQTVETVFIDHALPKGTMLHRGRAVDPSAVKRTALFTVEGENDDISGVGQTKAAHDLCSNIPPEKREHYMQPDVGHYGVFNGSRFRRDIVPRMLDFIHKNERSG